MGGIQMRLLMLGTGNAFAKKYYNNNALVKVDGYTLLIDCGVTATLSLYQLQIPLNRIDGIFITHLHADHIGGLEELAYQNLYLFKRKPQLFVPEKLLEPLWENSLKAGMDEPLHPGGLDRFFHVVKVAEQTSLQIRPHLRLEAMQTQHVPGKPSYSLFLNNLFYSADVIFDADLIRYAHDQRKCHRILHDCQLSQPATVHASLEQLLTLPEPIQEKILLMHYDDTMEQWIGKTGKMSFILQHVPYSF
jgi:ribonuclease BN (tRNA processing enzyme)